MLNMDFQRLFVDSSFLQIFQELNCVYFYITAYLGPKQYHFILYYCTVPRVSRPRARSKDFLFPCRPSTATQGQGTAASLRLDIVTNLAVEVLPAWFLQGLLSYSAADHTCAVCRFIYRPGGSLPS